MDNINNIKQYEESSCKPKNLDELKNIVEKTIENNGPKCDLNFIDVSNITDMSKLFWKTKFDGDISKWDVSHVEIMNEMFCKSKFTGDISSWDVSNVKEMEGMFKESEFYDIRILSKWYPHKNVKYQNDVFDYSPLHGMHFKCFK